MNDGKTASLKDARDGERQPYMPYPLAPAAMTLWLERGAWLGEVGRQLAEHIRRSGHPGAPSPGI